MSEVALVVGLYVYGRGALFPKRLPYLTCLPTANHYTPRYLILEEHSKVLYSIHDQS